MNNSALQVFAGGWAQLAHAKFQAKQLLAMGAPVAISWKGDGDMMFVADGSSDSIEEHTAVIPWDVIGLTSTASSPSIVALEPNVRSMIVSPDGSRLWITGLGFDRITQIDILTHWDITTLDVGSPSFFDPTQTATTISGMSITDRGRKLFLLVADEVYEYNLSIPYDTSSGVSFVTSKNLSAQSTDMTEIEFSSDGKFMYALSRAGYKVFRYRLKTRNTFADGIILLDDVALTNGGGSEFGLFIRQTDGKKLYTIGFGDDSVNCFDMSLTENESLITQLGEEIVTEKGEAVVIA